MMTNNEGAHRVNPSADLRAEVATTSDIIAIAR